MVDLSPPGAAPFDSSREAGTTLTLKFIAVSFLGILDKFFFLSFLFV